MPGPEEVGPSVGWQPDGFGQAAREATIEREAARIPLSVSRNTSRSLHRVGHGVSVGDPATVIEPKGRAGPVLVPLVLRLAGFGPPYPRGTVWPGPRPAACPGTGPEQPARRVARPRVSPPRAPRPMYRGRPVTGDGTDDRSCVDPGPSAARRRCHRRSGRLRNGASGDQVCHEHRRVPGRSSGDSCGERRLRQPPWGRVVGSFLGEGVRR